MNVELLLLNERCDELGRLPMQTVCVAAAGSTTAPPDLPGDMARMGEHIVLALAQEGMAPALDPIGIRIAVSRALLAPQDGAVRIPLTVCPLGEGPADGGAAGKPSPARPAGPDQVGGDGPGATTEAPEWDDLFSLGGEGDGLADEGGSV